jgi:hypothetical protein
VTFALFLLYVALSYIHPGEIFPELAPLRIAYWVGLAGLAVAIASPATRKSGAFGNLQLCVLIVFAAVAGLSLMVAERWPGAPILVIQRFGPSLAMFVLAMCSVTSPFRLRIAASCVIALTMTLLLQGAAAYHLGYNVQMFAVDRTTKGDGPAVATAEDQADDDSADSVESDSDDIAGDDEAGRDLRIRGLGMMHDPNDLAMGIIVALGLLVGGVTGRTARLQLRSLLLAAVAAALVYGLYLTRSRGGALALLVVLWRFVGNRIGRLPALILLVVLGAGATALDFGGRSLSMPLDESASERLVAWSEGLEMLKAHPILGVGYGQFADHHTLTAHNSLVLCFAETGLLGCFFWVGLLVVTLIELHRLKNLAGDDPFDDMARRWAEGLQLSLIGFIAAAFFLSRAFVPTLYLVIGLSGALAAIARGAGRQTPRPALRELGALVLACELGGIAVVYTIVKLHVG